MTLCSVLLRMAELMCVDEIELKDIFEERKGIESNCVESDSIVTDSNAINDMIKVFSKQEYALDNIRDFVFDCGTILGRIKNTKKIQRKKLMKLVTKLHCYPLMQ